MSDPDDPRELASFDALEDVDVCPVCASNPAGWGECPASREIREMSDEDKEPLFCPCCDECRQHCLGEE